MNHPCRWVQNLQNFRWDEEDVNRRLDKVMTEVISPPMCSLLSLITDLDWRHCTDRLWSNEPATRCAAAAGARFSLPMANLLSAAHALLQAFAGLWEVAQRKDVPLRTAAFIKALQRVTRCGGPTQSRPLNATVWCHEKIVAACF